MEVLIYEALQLSVSPLGDERENLNVNKISYFTK